MMGDAEGVSIKILSRSLQKLIHFDLLFFPSNTPPLLLPCGFSNEYFSVFIAFDVVKRFCHPQNTLSFIHVHPIYQTTIFLFQHNFVELEQIPSSYSPSFWL